MACQPPCRVIPCRPSLCGYQNEGLQQSTITFSSKMQILAVQGHHRAGKSLNLNLPDNNNMLQVFHENTRDINTCHKLGDAHWGREAIEGGGAKKFHKRTHLPQRITPNNYSIKDPKGSGKF
ncbi:hypothetical protein C5167_006546 [Papaver somniferum]|uniref:Uncharacterized protein n=1 Tax=Papaver somniferum TaxID=3469 RepID=A0A4Y7JH32_PAPSO|nr:hypothetical protein C5167_006546 [Papaver somniferum]